MQEEQREVQLRRVIMFPRVPWVLLALWLLIAAGWLMLAGWLLSIPHGIAGYAVVDVVSTVGSLLVALLVAPLVVWLIPYLLQPILILDAHAIKYAGLVLDWADVRSISVRKTRLGQTVIALELRDPSAFLAHMPRYAAASYYLQFRLGNPSIYIGAVRGMSIEQLLSLFVSFGERAMTNSRSDRSSGYIEPEYLTPSWYYASMLATIPISAYLLIDWQSLFGCFAADRSLCRPLHLIFSLAAAPIVYFAANRLIQSLRRRRPKFDPFVIFSFLSDIYGVPSERR
jgi:hypothetical protein